MYVAMVRRRESSLAFEFSSQEVHGRAGTTHGIIPAVSRFTHMNTIQHESSPRCKLSQHTSISLGARAHSSPENGLVYLHTLRDTLARNYDYENDDDDDDYEEDPPT